MGAKTENVTIRATAPDGTDLYCYDGPLDEMTRAHLYIAAVRTKTHVHETSSEHGMCLPCMQDALGIGRHGFALLNLINDLERQLAEREVAAA